MKQERKKRKLSYFFSWRLFLLRSRIDGEAIGSRITASSVVAEEEEEEEEDEDELPGPIRAEMEGRRRWAEGRRVRMVEQRQRAALMGERRERHSKAMRWKGT